MNKAKFIIPFAAAILLAGCTVSSPATSSSADASKDSSASPIDSESSVTPPDSSSSSIPDPISSSDSESGNTSDSSSGSSSDSEEPKPVAITISDLEAYVKTFTDNASAVSGGTIEKTHKGSYSWDDSSSSTTFHYGSDSNGATLKAVSSDKTTYVMKDASGAIVSVDKDENGNYSKGDSFESVAPYFSDYLESKTAYGVEGFLSSVVASGKENPNGDFLATKDSDSADFSFTYFVGEGESIGSVYKVIGSFVYTGENLTVLSFSFIGYSGSGKYSYDSSSKKVTIAEGATADWTDTYLISQNVSARTYTNDIDLNSFKHETLTLKDSQGNVLGGDAKLSVTKGDLSIISIESSSNANLDFDPLTMTIVSGPEGGVSYEFKRGYDGSETLEITAATEGDYEIKVSSASDVSATFDLTVEGIVVTSLDATLYSEDFNGEINSKSLDSGSTINTYVGLTTYIGFTPDPYNASLESDLTFSVFDESWEAVDKDDYDLDLDDNIGGEDGYSAVSFYTEIAGTYWLKVEGNGTDPVMRSYKIVVAEDNFANILSATTFKAVQDGDGKYTFKFTPSEECEGSVVITDLATNAVTTTAYTLSKADDYEYYEFDFEDTVDFESLVLGEDRQLYIEFDSEDDWYYALQDASSSESGDDSGDSTDSDFPSNWTGACEDDTYAASVSNAILNFDEGGEVYGNITFDDTPYVIHCDYTITEDQYAPGYYEVRFFEGDAVEEATNEWFEDLPVVASYDPDTGISINTTEINGDLTFKFTPVANS